MKLQTIMNGIDAECKKRISEGEQRSPEFKRDGWTRTLILSSCYCHLIWSDTKIKYDIGLVDFIVEDWNILPQELKAETVEEAFRIYNPDLIGERDIYLDFREGFKRGKRSGRIERNSEYKNIISLINNFIRCSEGDDKKFLQKARAFEIDIYHECGNLEPVLKVEIPGPFKPPSNRPRQMG